MLSIVIKSNAIYRVRVRREEKAWCFKSSRNHQCNGKKNRKGEKTLGVNTYISSPLRGLECDHNDQELEGGDVSVDCEQ